jgi:hypothetical protein
MMLRAAYAGLIEGDASCHDASSYLGIGAGGRGEIAGFLSVPVCLCQVPCPKFYFIMPLAISGGLVFAGFLTR